MLEPLPLNALAAACAGELLGEGGVAVTGLAIDSRDVAPGDLFVAIPGARVDGHDYVQTAARQGAAAALVRRPVDVDLPQLVVVDQEAALAEFGRLARASYQGVLVGITGSAGKTTAKNLLAAAFAGAGRVIATEGNRNNELGVPLTITRLQPTTEFAVLEMGAGKPGDIAYLQEIVRPTTGVLLNVAAAHLEFYHSLDDIADTKGAILEHLPEHGLAVFNADQPWAAQWRERAGNVRCLTFGRDQGADYRADNVVLRGFSGSTFDVVGPDGRYAIELKLAGWQGIYNALAAFAVAHAHGVSAECIARGFLEVEPASGRGQVIEASPDLFIVDDSYNANPLAMRAAIDVLATSPGTRRLVMGSMLELGVESARMHADIGAYARDAGIEELWAVGGSTVPAAESFGASARWFSSLDSLLAAPPELPQRGTVLVKASRGAALEAVVSHWSAYVGGVAAC